MRKYEFIFGIVLAGILPGCNPDRPPEKQSETVQLDQKREDITPHDSDAGRVDSEMVFRVGWTHSEYDSNGIFVYEKIRNDLQFHVFSKTGKEVYSSSSFKKEESEGCSSDDVRTTWNLLPETIYNTDEFRALYDPTTPSSGRYPLVVGTTAKMRFAAPTILPISNEEQNACLKILGISEEERFVSLESLGITDSGQVEVVRFLGAGIRGGTTRILVEKSIDQIPDEDSPGVTIRSRTIAIIDLEGNQAEIIYKHTEPGHEGVAFGGMADLDGDGLCESFLVDFGDFGGKWFLIGKAGKWEMWMDDSQPGPC